MTYSLALTLTGVLGLLTGFTLGRLVGRYKQLRNLEKSHQALDEILAELRRK